jgi:hypothetical protein
MNYQELPGIYESEKIESSSEGVPTDEMVRPGMFTFTRDGRLSVVSASNKMVMAYAGSYTVENDALKIAIESCVYREMEGTAITRRILSFDGTRLVLEAVGSKGKERSVLTWKKKIAL